MFRLVLLLLLILAGPAAACGRDTDCIVAGGTYRLALPAGEATGVIVFYHGWPGTAGAVMTYDSFLSAAHARGLAVAAPQGRYLTWSVPGSPATFRDELAFADAVMADLGRRGLPVERAMAMGFSLGGSMVWTLACHRGDLFAGFAPVAGAYWEPLPEDCTEDWPVLIHIHGQADTTMPLDGRQHGPSRQASVYESFRQWDRACEDARPPRLVREGGLICNYRSVCGGHLELCMHEGAHRWRVDWAMWAWDRLAEIRGWP